MAHRIHLSNHSSLIRKYGEGHFLATWVFFIQRGKVRVIKHHGLGQISSWQFKIAETVRGSAIVCRRKEGPVRKDEWGLSRQPLTEELLRKGQSSVQC